MKQSSRSRRRRSGRRESSRANEGPARLEELAGRFAALRSVRGRGRRIPGDLRSGVLEAVGAGVPWSELKRRCGVSRQQVERWAAERAEAASVAPGSCGGSVRTFAVVDDGEAVSENAAGAAEPELEFRLGQWSVKVALVETGKNRGGSACSR